jgi:prepilin-type N-terminal cleavage/methylation domain-containing protein
MITTIRSQNRLDPRRRGTRGFSLFEVMVGATLAGIILAGTLTTFLFLGRSGANLRNYSDMEAQARTSLEIFAQDTRQASSVTWFSADSVKLIVNATEIYYAFSAGNFTRTTGTGSTTLLTGITSFNFSAYDINGTAITDFSNAAALTTANNATKQVQISLSAARSTQTVATATNIVLSARYVLRNKKVTA